MRAYPLDAITCAAGLTMHTPSQIAILASELEGCQSVGGEVYVPTKLANRVLAALREFEQDKREWVTVERMDR